MGRRTDGRVTYPLDFAHLAVHFAGDPFHTLDFATSDQITLALRPCLHAYDLCDRADHLLFVCDFEGQNPTNTANFVPTGWSESTFSPERGYTLLGGCVIENGFTTGNPAIAPYLDGTKGTVAGFKVALQNWANGPGGRAPQIYLDNITRHMGSGMAQSEINRITNWSSSTEDKRSTRG